MNQLKVFEFAKEIGVETLALMDKIREWKLPVRSHMATLDDAMMADIKTRLEAATAAATEEAAKAKKKVARKKAAADKEEAGTAAPAKAKASAAKKIAAPVKKAVAAAPAAPVTAAKATTAKAAAPKAAAPKAAAAKTAKKAAAPEVAPSRAPAVIRRKAGEAEAKALELAAAAEAEAAAAAAAAAENQAENLTASGEPGAEVAASAEAGGETAAIRPEEPRRRNIVGRMDLRRVANIQTQSGPQGPGIGTPSNPRVPRTAPRNIRPGFYSAEPTPTPPTGFAPHPSRIEVKDDKNKKRPGPGGGAGGGGREEEVKIFTATEFRKREVIFQPKKKKISTGRENKKTQLTTPAAHKRIVKVDSTITLQALANEIGVKAPVLLKKLMAEGVQASMNTDLDFDTVALIVPGFGWEAQNIHQTVDQLITAGSENVGGERITRPPVVTVMGHVDHGKTTLLDSIRKANVVKGEAGGITQHIGAYSVTLDDGHQVTFIDTPGHEAFTAMRARGANATDIAIIVVAADDGMMPQTAEAINHAKAAGVPIIVAVNKIDKPGANSEKIKQQLTEFELVPEEWGGTTIYAEVSALKGTGIKELLEHIHLVAEMQELKADPKRSGTGIVIESRVEKGRGVVATLLVQDGHVAVGQDIVAGNVPGRVRSMLDDKGKPVKDVGPGMPVEILGLSETPMAGDRFDIVRDEDAARSIAKERIGRVKHEEGPNSKMTLDQLFARVKTGDTKELALVLKVDVAGSLEAVKGMIDKIGNSEVKLKLIHAAVGGVNESDVLLASTSKGVVVGFGVRPDQGATRMAKEKGIEIKTYSIIYELVDDLKKALTGMLTPDVVEKAMGRAEVRNTFTVPKMGMIAGSFVTEGKIARNNMLRLVRDGKIIFEGKVGSLKRFKDDAKEVAAGFECGIGIENFNDIKVGDVIESFVKEEKVREL
ncbi:MAG: translation initiation factor IF-2 [Bdellovibrionales bacterium]